LGELFAGSWEGGKQDSDEGCKGFERKTKIFLLYLVLRFVEIYFVHLNVHRHVVALGEKGIRRGKDLERKRKKREGGGKQKGLGISKDWVELGTRRDIEENQGNRSKHAFGKSESEGME
jgi:hypothetical protein